VRALRRRVLFHPDYDRRLRDHTGICSTRILRGGCGARGLAIRTQPDGTTAGGDFHPALRTCTSRTLTLAQGPGQLLPAADRVGVLAGLGSVAGPAGGQAGHFQPASRADPGNAAVVLVDDGEQAVVDAPVVCG
jgi:hypothetical protein